VLFKTFALVRKDLQLIFLGGGGLVQAILLGLLLIFVFSLATPVGEKVLPQAAAAIFWLASSFALIHYEVRSTKPNLVTPICTSRICAPFKVNHSLIIFTSATTTTITIHYDSLTIFYILSRVITTIYCKAYVIDS